MQTKRHATLSFLLVGTLAGAACAAQPAAQTQPAPIAAARASSGPVIAIHGGAGTILREQLSADGSTIMAGAVAGVMRIKNPITLARLVMERSAHVFMAREGAEAFGREHGVETVDPDYFFTRRRWDALQRAREAEARAAGAGGAASATHGEADWRLGTVGAVALDLRGRLAAATSTGGMTNKRFGRIGDVPVIGAGTYANDRCAISGTGHGEFFIRNVVAFDICARATYFDIPLVDAADAVIMMTLADQGGDGGVIALDAEGNVSMPFNTPGMYRGFIDRTGRLVVEIFRD